MKFIREDFEYHGGYLMYLGDCGEHNDFYGEDAHPTRVGKRRDKFVARFKYASTSSKGPWITFMIKNFTVEEYFGRLDAGETPLGILESKGFILSHVKKMLKRGGYPVTQEGLTQMIKDDMREVA